VTLFSTGYATDPNDSARVVTHRVRAVVRLVPRKLATSKPSGFDNFANGDSGVAYTLYQWSTGACQINVPFRVHGPVRIQQKLDLALPGSAVPWYSWSSDARQRYLKDLNVMRLAGSPDYRPLGGPVYLPYSQQDGGFVSLLTAMQVSTVDTSTQGLSGWSSPSSMTSYQIYPGGKTYTVPSLGAEQRNVTLQPDPITNPAGIFFRTGQLRLYDNVRIQGTLMSKSTDDGDILISGKNVHIEPVDLPSLYGSSAAVQLPVIVAGDDLHFLEGSQVSVAGLIVSTDDFKIADDPQYSPLTVQVSSGNAGKTLQDFLAASCTNFSATELRRMILAGSVEVDGQVVVNPAAVVKSGQQVAVRTRILLSRVFARDIYVGGRSEWFLSSTMWKYLYELFGSQSGTQGGIAWFAEWLDVWGLEKEPQFGIHPDATQPAPRYTWKNSQDPIYAVNPDDGGLRWELLEWTDLH